MTRERLTTWLLLASTFAIRAIHPGQPIVENYVGRQVPTAMVARNLERGSGFLHPQLDTGPFPNLFLVEPPIYAQVVATLHSAIGFDWEATGRLVSAAATTLAAWGLFGLVRRREGEMVAVLAGIAFAMFPVMIRYGRAFQPDALMLGCLLAGFRGWDEFESTGDRRWLAFGGFVFSLALATKITAAWALLPFCLMVRRWPIARRLAASALMMLPALAWYLRAWDEVARPGAGSLASIDNASLWARSLSPASWLHSTTWTEIGRGLAIRSFTPIGFVLAGIGLVGGGKLDRLWVGWGVGCGLAVVALAAKWHHAYYWMAVAPLASVGVARSLPLLWGWSRPIAVGLGSSLLSMGLVQSMSTWQTPVEWRSVVASGRELAALATDPGSDGIVAPEALLYYADRRGLRLEFEDEAMRRAAGEWGGSLPERSQPLDLVGFYARELRERTQPSRAGVDLIADLGPALSNSPRAAFREAIRASPDYQVVVDQPEFLVAKPR